MSETILVKNIPLRIAMLTYSFYESDNRVRRYAETLVKNGATVDVFSLRSEKQLEYNQIKGVRIYRIQERTRNEKWKLTYLIRILKFFIKSAISLTRKHLEQKYDLVHVHSVPDFEVFSAILPKLLGSKTILDIHDPVPDFFSAKFGYGKNSIFFKTLKLIELLSVHFADHVITVTGYWRDVIKKRTKISNQKISSIVNYCDTENFNLNNHKGKTSSNGYFTILYPGTLNKHCGLDIVIKAIAALEKSIPNIRLDIYGKGSEIHSLRSLSRRLGIERSVIFHDTVPLDEIPILMANADIGIALLSGDNAYARQALNVKLFEFLAMGLPAIATKVESIEKYLGDKVVMLSKPNDVEDVARCIKELYRNFDKRIELREAGLAFTIKYNWQTQANIYLNIIKNLFPEMKNT
jgi:glycosyltransferase involved in cell wall biosynthesis